MNRSQVELLNEKCVNVIFYANKASLRVNHEIEQTNLFLALSFSTRGNGPIGSLFSPGSYLDRVLSVRASPAKWPTCNSGM